MKKRTIFTLLAATMTLTVGSSNQRNVAPVPPVQVDLIKPVHQDTVVKSMHELEALLTALDEKL